MLPKSRRGRSPAGRSVIGRASFTTIARPSRSLLFHIEIAASATSSGTSTKPKPRDRPVILSDITVAEMTSPACEKASLRLSEVVAHARFPTYSFFAIRYFFWVCLIIHSRPSGANQPGKPVPLASSNYELRHYTTLWGLWEAACGRPRSPLLPVPEGGISVQTRSF